MKKGEIVLVRFPFSDLHQSKLRPAVILIPEDKFGDVCLAFITSKIIEGDDAVVIREGNKRFKATGLKVSSTIRVRKIATIRVDLLVGRLGRLHSEHLRELNKALSNLFGL